MSTPQALYKNNCQTLLMLFFIMCSVDSSQISCPTGCKACYSGVCYQCADGFFVDSSTQSCQQCSLNCRECSSTSSCNSCAVGYGLKSQTDRWCIDCLEGCTDCRGVTVEEQATSLAEVVCTQCSAGFIFAGGFSGRCIPKLVAQRLIIGGATLGVLFVSFLAIGIFTFRRTRVPANKQNHTNNQISVEAFSPTEVVGAGVPQHSCQDDPVDEGIGQQPPLF